MKRFITHTLLFISLLSFASSAFALDIRTYQYHQAIQRMLNKNQPVYLGVVIDKVGTSFTGDWVPNWKETMKDSMIVDMQNSILRYSGFTDYEIFGLIDRAGIDSVLNELKFQQTGYLTAKDRAKMGELLGITHILFQTYSRFPASAPYDMQDQADFRLVEIKTGRVLATDTVFSKKYSGKDKWTPWEFKTGPK